MLTESTIQKLSSVGSHFLRQLSPEDTYAALVNEAKRLVDADAGSVFLWYRKKLHRVYTSIPDKYQLHPRRRGHAYEVFRSGIPHIISRRELLKVHPEAKDMPVHSLIIIPLSYEKQTIGVLTLHASRNKKMTKQLQQILRIFGTIGTLSIKKTQLNEEAKEALRMRDLFISLAAHELRTPLTTMNAYVHLLSRKVNDPQKVETKWIRELSSETSLIIKLVNELLNVDLIRNGVFSYHMQPISLRKVINRAAQQFSIAFPFHTVMIEDECSQDDTLIGDTDKLLQVLSSILQNAAKFSGVDKKILLTYTCKKEKLYISISDNGIGILRKDIKKIFSGFYKGSNNYMDGIGLGLFISKRIIMKHKGNITITSGKDKGTKVTIMLPRNIK